MQKGKQLKDLIFFDPRFHPSITEIGQSRFRMTIRNKFFRLFSNEKHFTLGAKTLNYALDFVLNWKFKLFPFY